MDYATGHAAGATDSIINNDAKIISISIHYDANSFVRALLSLAVLEVTTAPY